MQDQSQNNHCFSRVKNVCDILVGTERATKPADCLLVSNNNPGRYKKSSRTIMSTYRQTIKSFLDHNCATFLLNFTTVSSGHEQIENVAENSIKQSRKLNCIKNIFHPSNNRIN